MILLKKQIESFLTLNSEKKSLIRRYFQEIDSINLSNLFEKFSAIYDPVFFFSKPSNNYTFLSIGCLAPGLFEKIFPYLSPNEQYPQKNFIDNSTLPREINIPLFIGSKKFTDDKKESVWKDFDYQDWFIPKILLIRKNDSYYIVVNFIMGDSNLSMFDSFENILADNTLAVNSTIQKFSNEKQNSHFEWDTRVKHFLEQIRSGNIEKAVLARRIIISLKDFSYSKSLQILQSKYPDCFTFAFKKINSVFFGATPEKLFSTSDSYLQTEAIAGSAPRGNNEAEDQQFENMLMNTPKELREHENVVKFIQENLNPFVNNLLTDEKLGVKKLKNIQHIRTGISANIKKGINILDIVKSLHPTPAVCGFPRKEAFDLIEQTEDFDRGLYSGIIGWFDENMNSEFVVGIRSALITNNKLYAYAGCGIVEGSDSTAEFKETELKLNPILSVLNNEITS